MQCYDQSLLPAEHRGLSWATRGERIDLTSTDWQLERAATRVIPVLADGNGNGKAHTTTANATATA